MEHNKSFGLPVVVDREMVVEAIIMTMMTTTKQRDDERRRQSRGGCKRRGNHHPKKAKKHKNRFSFFFPDSIVTILFLLALPIIVTGFSTMAPRTAATTTTTTMRGVTLFQTRKLQQQQRPVLIGGERTVGCAAVKNLDNDSSNRDNDTTTTYPTSDGTVSASTIYFEIGIAGGGPTIGRLIFDLANHPSPLPYHTENIIQLVKGSRRGIDPLAHYVGCEFDYSPLSIEEPNAASSLSLSGRYRWSHQLRGRGRNAIGRADQPIVDVEHQLKNTHSCFGGQYYGMLYNTNDNDKDDPGVLLTVPILGPGHGTSKFSIVRVGESPKEWKERLLINSGVIGRLRSESLPVLHQMARQRQGPPTVVAAGIIDP